MAVLVLLMIPAGLIMTSEGVERPLQDRLFIFHKGTGALLLVLVAIRLIWRATHPAPPLPDSVPRVQQIAARTVHAGLYLVLVVMVVSGYVRTVMGGFPIELLDLIGIPPLLPENKAVAEIAKIVHATAKNVLIVLIVLHIGAALFHGVWLRDGVFLRMWPPVARSPRIEPAD